MKYFYSHLIEIESVFSQLDQMDLSEEERLHLAQLIDSSLHHSILDAILSQLPDQEKRVFMQHVSEGSNDQIWKFLNEKIEGVEIKIKKAAEDLKNELHEDLTKAKQTK